MSSTFNLCVSLAAAAALGIAPAARQLFPARGADAGAVPLWVYLLLAGAAMQIALAWYAVQLPHWASMRVLAMFETLLAAIYAMLLGIALAAGPGNAVLQQLELAAQAETPHLPIWCLLMLVVQAALAYACGHATEKLRRAAKTLEKL